MWRSVHTHSSPYLPPHSPQTGCFVSVCFANSGHLAPLSRVFTDSQCVYKCFNEGTFRKRAVNASEGVCGLWSVLHTLNSPGWHFIILEFIVFTNITLLCVTHYLLKATSKNLTHNVIFCQLFGFVSMALCIWCACVLIGRPHSVWTD